MSELTNCPGCGRHCPINNLHCSRGERIVQSYQAKSDPSTPIKKSPVSEKKVVELTPLNQQLVKKFEDLGRYITYLDKNQKNETLNTLFSALSQEDKEDLLKTLSQFKYDLSKIKEPERRHSHHVNRPSRRRYSTYHRSHHHRHHH